MTTVSTVLEAVGLTAGYHRNPVIRGLDLRIGAGEVVGLLGANGAGKTTTLLTLAGAIRPIDGQVRFLGEAATDALHARAGRGLGFVTEEKSVIFGLTVMDNLRLGRGSIDLAFELFPELVPLKKRVAGTLSGGEQQILTFARALSREPKALLADELSLGLAPLVVDRLGLAVRQAANVGVAVLLVEQQARTALKICDRAYILRRGEIVMGGTSSELMCRIDELESGYLSE